MSTIHAPRPARSTRPLLGLRTRPGRLALLVFRLPLILYRSGRGRLLGRTFMLLVHAGRRTGEPHEMTAMVLRYDPGTREVVICANWGAESDWVRNLRVRPGLRVQVGRESFTPQHRFLGEDEAFTVASEFCHRHPRRVWLASRIFGWGDMTTDVAVREFVASRPFVAFRPA
jgi:deazaflavin-dependent oxidoreductase (nitroreductase family)